MAAPKWVKTIIEKFCNDRNLDTPGILWYSRKNIQYTSGLCDYERKRIFIGAGSYKLNFNGKNRDDIKLTLLHELTHWSLPETEGHSALFWDTAWEVYREYKMPIRYCLAWEGLYKKGAITAYKRNVNKRRLNE